MALVSQDERDSWPKLETLSTMVKLSVAKIGSKLVKVCFSGEMELALLTIIPRDS